METQTSDEDDTIETRYAKLLASVPNPFSGESLETLLEHLDSYYYCLLDSDATSSVVDKGSKGIDSYVSNSLSKLEAYTSGDTYVPEGEIRFVAPHGCVDLINEISKENLKSNAPTVCNVFLQEKPRKWMEDLTKQMLALNAEDKLDFKEFNLSLNNSANIVGKVAPIPLEVLWWLHNNGLLLFTTYIYDNLGDTSKLGELMKDLISLVCCFDSTEIAIQQPQTQDDNKVSIERQMVKDLLESLLVASQRTHMKCSKACSVLLDSVMKKALCRLLSEDSYPPGNYMSVLREDPLLSEEDLGAFASDVLHRFLTVCPTITLTAAISRQTEWLYNKTRPCVAHFLRDVLQCLGIPRVLKILQDDLSKAEINWNHLLVTVSTFVVCVEDARKHVKALVGALIEESLASKNKETLASAFLIVRQCCAEGDASFPSYATWFGVAFSSDTTSAEFKFLIQFLQELVPIEPAYCLRAHISKPPTTPSGLHHLTAEYNTIARSRLVDLKEDSTVSLLGNESLDTDVAQIVQHFSKTGNVYPPLISAANLLRQPFERELVPRLIAGGHRGVVNKLIKMGQLTEKLVERLSKINQEGVDNTPFCQKEDSLQEAKMLLAGAAEKLEMRCDLQGNLDKAVASLVEMLPMRDHKDLQFSSEFGVKYLSLANLQSDLAAPPCLVKKTAFACERLRCYDQRAVSVTDQRLCAGGELSLTEWLDFESAMTEEFLDPSSQRLYLRKVKARYMSDRLDFREMLTTLVDRMLITADKSSLLATAAGLVTQILPGSELGGEETPVLLDLWSKLSFVHSHEVFFRIAKLLPEWLLLTNSLVSIPTRETIQILASLISDDLLDVLSRESLLLPEFVSHLMMGFDHVHSAVGADVTRGLLDLLLELCTPFYLAVLVYFKDIRCFLEPLFPPDSDAAQWTTLARMRDLLLAVFKTDAFTLDHVGLQFADSWEMAAIIWFHRLKDNTLRPSLEGKEAELLNYRTVSHWLFFFRVMELGHALNAGRAVFSVANNRLWFVCDDIACESPLRVLELCLSVDPSAVSMLEGNESVNMFSLKSLRLVSIVGLLFLIERGRSSLASSADVLRILPTLGETFFTSLAKGLGPDFLAVKDETDVRHLTERRVFQEYVRKSCHEMMKAKPTPVPSKEPEIYRIDDDYFEIPDDLP